MTEPIWAAWASVSAEDWPAELPVWFCSRAAKLLWLIDAESVLAALEPLVLVVGVVAVVEFCAMSMSREYWLLESMLEMVMVGSFISRGRQVRVPGRGSQREDHADPIARSGCIWR
jgi:hypothetical protein